MHTQEFHKLLLLLAVSLPLELSQESKCVSFTITSSKERQCVISKVVELDYYVLLY